MNVDVDKVNNQSLLHESSPDNSSLSKRSGGRPRGSKNRPGHSAGGARRGAGRKPVNGSFQRDSSSFTFGNRRVPKGVNHNRVKAVILDDGSQVTLEEHSTPLDDFSNLFDGHFDPHEQHSTSAPPDDTTPTFEAPRKRPRPNDHDDSSTNVQDDSSQHHDNHHQNQNNDFLNSKASSASILSFVNFHGGAATNNNNNDNDSNTNPHNSSALSDSSSPRLPQSSQQQVQEQQHEESQQQQDQHEQRDDTAMVEDEEDDNNNLDNQNDQLVPANNVNQNENMNHPITKIENQNQSKNKNNNNNKNSNNEFSTSTPIRHPSPPSIQSPSTTPSVATATRPRQPSDSASPGLGSSPDPRLDSVPPIAQLHGYVNSTEFGNSQAMHNLIEDSVQNHKPPKEIEHLVKQSHGPSHIAGPYIVMGGDQFGNQIIGPADPALLQDKSLVCYYVVYERDVRRSRRPSRLTFEEEGSHPIEATPLTPEEKKLLKNKRGGRVGAFTSDIMAKWPAGTDMTKRVRAPRKCMVCDSFVCKGRGGQRFCTQYQPPTHGTNPPGRPTSVTAAHHNQAAAARRLQVQQSLANSGNNNNNNDNKAPAGPSTSTPSVHRTGGGPPPPPPTSTAPPSSAPHLEIDLSSFMGDGPHDNFATSAPASDSAFAQRVGEFNTSSNSPTQQQSQDPSKNQNDDSSGLGQVDPALSANP